MTNAPRSNITTVWCLFLFSLALPHVQSCGVCVGVAALPHHARSRTAAWVVTTRLAEHQPLLVGTALVAHEWVRHEQRRRRRRRAKRPAFLTAAEEGSLQKSDDDEQDTAQEEKPPLTTAMVASIGFYKKFISPLLPPACRFLPTCSQYGVQAIERFGPTKGAILTAWRLLRCSPLGGKGYDPPRWPPVSYTGTGAD